MGNATQCVNDEKNQNDTTNQSLNQSFFITPYICLIRLGLALIIISGVLRMTFLKCWHGPTSSRKPSRKSLPAALEVQKPEMALWRTLGLRRLLVEGRARSARSTKRGSFPDTAFSICFTCSLMSGEGINRAYTDHHSFKWRPINTATRESRSRLHTKQISCQWCNYNRMQYISFFRAGLQSVLGSKLQMMALMRPCRPKSQ